MSSSSELPSSPDSPDAPIHPFANSTSRLEIIRDGIDVEEESRLYDALCDDEEARMANRPRARSLSPGPPSVFSREIWLGDHSGESSAFTSDVKISGWSNVGDKKEGAYIVYDCVIKTKEGTVIHAHKRYSAFAQLEATLRRTLPRTQQHFIPPLPPKNPLARYRPTFLSRRRRLLQNWLAAILLHPDFGGCEVVRAWIMN